MWTWTLPRSLVIKIKKNLQPTNEDLLLQQRQKKLQPESQVHAYNQTVYAFPVVYIDKFFFLQSSRYIWKTIRKISYSKNTGIESME